MTTIAHASPPTTQQLHSTQPKDADQASKPEDATSMTNDAQEAGIEARAKTLSQQARQNPGAFSLQMSETTNKTQRDVAALAEKLQQDLKAGKISAENIPDVIGSFEKILKEANAIEVQEGNGILGQYAQYMSDLSSLMVRINALVTQQGDKPKLRTQDMLDAMEEFRRKYSGDKGVIKSFANKADAEEFAKRFHGGTVTIEKVHTTIDPDGPVSYNVRFNVLALSPVIHALCDDKSKADRIMQMIENGTPFNAKAVYDLTRTLVTNSAVVQGLSLATSDVQKTFQTDLDLQISGLSRSISQYDNLVKLFSSMMSSLESTYKSFLQ
ncbi:hypothetical protein MyNCGM683_51850 [Achromobacter xylosoxidans]